MNPNSEKNTTIAQVNFKVDKEKEFRKYVKYLSSPWQIMWRNFLVGTFQGLGFALGTALILTFFGYLFGQTIAKLPAFENVGNFFEQIIETSEGFKK